MNDCINYVIRETNCKNCGKLLRIKIDPSNVPFGESMLKIAHCNHCADLKVERRRFETRIYRTTYLLSFDELQPERREVIKGALFNALVAWTKIEAELQRVVVPGLDEQVYENMVKFPKQSGQTLHQWRETISTLGKEP